MNNLVKTCEWMRLSESVKCRLRSEVNDRRNNNNNLGRFTSQFIVMMDLDSLCLFLDVSLLLSVAAPCANKLRCNTHSPGFGFFFFFSPG